MPAAMDSVPMVDGLADADAVGQPAHRDAADAVADPDQRARQRQHRAVGMQCGLHVAQTDDREKR